MTQVVCTDSSTPKNDCQPNGKFIVVTGPSGVGKGTILARLLERHPELYRSISVTTRSPRQEEIHGKDYYFVSRNQF